MAYNVVQQAGENVSITTSFPSSGTGTSSITITWASGVDAVLLRGTTDTDITALALRNASGTKCYIYPDSTGTGITVSTTAP